MPVKKHGEEPFIGTVKESRKMPLNHSADYISYGKIFTRFIGEGS